MEPKSTASTNSATLARKIRKFNVLYLHVSVGHYENFPVASIALPARVRAAVQTIYRFARSADDIADEGEDPSWIRLEKLAVYRARLVTIAAGGKPPEPLFRDVAAIVRGHDLPLSLFTDLLDAFSQDVTKKRYASYAEVLDYCRRSANPVGRLLLHLFKRTTERELSESDAICTALQLTNFWQDVGRDYAENNRVYLPQDEMARFGVSELHLIEKTCDDAWRSLMKFQVDRTRSLMMEGAPLGRSLPGRIGWEIRATIQGGLRILEKIEAVGYDIWRKRPVLGPLDWPAIVLKAV